MMGVSQNRFRSKGASDMITTAVRAVVNPFAGVVTRGVDGVRDSMDSFGKAPALAQENLRLRDQLKSLEDSSSREDNLKREIEDLKLLLKLEARFTGGSTPAEILGFFPYENRITLSAGSNQGVKPGQAVIAGSGLLGVIQTVSANSSQANLIYSQQVRVGAMINTQPPIAGLLRGETITRLIFETPDTTTQIQTGTRVVTNGFSDRIPRGILIGIVERDETMPDFGTRTAKVVPAVNLSRVRAVLILK